ncbi:hypothetical protein LEL_08426 [Akanthomyces lecanii RCEF 1005]|uniref:Uncharacterized protein n=1 Tax=Akanthomyces lecanii RCEF 1005 TaxID=1081108 RepID=A0A162JRA6_CORDF|nr:hypothetical protein LEL_08426 [Akanthomyces lecanii RCEF 1005]
MASLPSQHPTLSLHLADDALTPLITSSRSRAHLESLTALTTSALTSQTAAQRVGMGVVERIMVEYPEPAAAAVVLQSYLHVAAPAAAEEASNGSSSNDNSSSSRNGIEGEVGGQQEDQDDDDAVLPPPPPPRLVGVVVARSAGDAREAKRAAARLEKVGREFQSQWNAASSS